MKMKPCDDVAFLKLIIRSADTGDGWRNVSTQLWPLVEKFKHQDLIELRGGNQVRLSSRGLVIADYI